MKLPQRAPLYRRSDSGISLLDGHASTDLRSRLFGSLAATVVSISCFLRALDCFGRSWLGRAHTGKVVAHRRTMERTSE
jgi:hypothetical protein